ncbi:hypothetical protein GQ600_12473 [Phytophthora cactorum]|nr:hypothetical protein GQ600_12473 [Phytophthora cactorum]
MEHHQLTLSIATAAAADAEAAVTSQRAPPENILTIHNVAFEEMLAHDEYDAWFRTVHPVETFNDRKQKADTLLTAIHTVTPSAKAMFDKQVWGAAACTARKSSQSVFFVDDAVMSVEESDEDRICANVAERPQQENI